MAVPFQRNELVSQTTDYAYLMAIQPPVSICAAERGEREREQEEACGRFTQSNTKH